MSQTKQSNQIKVDTRRADLTKKQQKDLESSLKDYDVENYDVIKFDAGIFRYEAIFKNKDTTILHFILDNRLCTKRVFEVIVGSVRRLIDGRAFSLESEWVGELSSLDIVLFKFRNSLGGRERFFNNLGRQVKEDLLMKL